MRTRVKGKNAIVRRLHGLRLALARFAIHRAQSDSDRRWACALADALDHAAAVAARDHDQQHVH
jgi:hypothetical protein